MKGVQMGKWVAVTVAAGIALSGCGGIYVSPQVVAQAGGAPVQVLAVTAQTVAEANQSAYTPRALPAVFSSVATATSQPNGGGLPAPTLRPPSVSQPLALRPLPDVAPGPYRIGVGDVLMLSTPAPAVDAPELAGLPSAQGVRRGYTVQDDGAIALPDAGRVPVGGLALAAAEEAVFAALLRAGIEPAFSLEVAEFNSQRVAVGGGVAQPGLVPITLVSLTLQDALAARGGIALTDRSQGSVRIYRQGTLYQIPLRDLYGAGGSLSRPLLPGDSVFVDGAVDLDQAQSYFEQQLMVSQARRAQQVQGMQILQAEMDMRRGQQEDARRNFEARLEAGAVARDYVYITGEVARQQRFPLPFEQQASLADALFEGGGGIPLRTGDMSQIYVLRATPEGAEPGAVTAWHLDARNPANLVLAARFELRPDDVVFVAEQPVTRWHRVIQQITPSLITSSVAAAGN